MSDFTEDDYAVMMVSVRLLETMRQLICKFLYDDDGALYVGEDGKSDELVDICEAHYCARRLKVIAEKMSRDDEVQAD